MDEPIPKEADTRCTVYVYSTYFNPGKRSEKAKTLADALAIKERERKKKAFENNRKNW